MGKKILGPQIGSIVCHTGEGIEDDSDYPCDVYILDGQYNVRQPDGSVRISNHWNWAKILPDGELGPREAGYGAFEESINEYEIYVDTKILKKNNKEKV